MGLSICQPIIPLSDVPLRFLALSRVHWRRCAAVFLAVAAMLGAGIPAQAADRIWSALVLATNDDPSTAKLPASLARTAPKIKQFFGYKSLEVVGEATKSMSEDCEKWLVPSQNFWVCVRAKRQPEEVDYSVGVRLYHDKRKLVEAETKLRAGSPLFIRGPMHARGQLIIVVEVID